MFDDSTVSQSGGYSMNIKCNRSPTHCKIWCKMSHAPLKDQYGPRIFFLEFPFFAKNMIIKSILNLCLHSKILKLFLGVVRGIFTKRLKRTRRLLYTVKYDFFQMTALHSKC